MIDDPVAGSARVGDQAGDAERDARGGAGEHGVAEAEHAAVARDELVSAGRLRCGEPTCRAGTDAGWLLVVLGEGSEFEELRRKEDGTDGPR
jgi:hypothetical protein